MFVDKRNLPATQSLGTVVARVESIQIAGSCNFCNRNEDREVILISGNRTSVRICWTCYHEIQRQLHDD